MIKVGVILTDLYDFSQNRIYNGLNDYCNKHNIQTFIFIGSLSSDYLKIDKRDESILSIVNCCDLDGIIMLSSPISSIIGLEALNCFISNLPQIPKISIGIDIPGLTSIVVDNKNSVIKIMDHLIQDHGLKKIAFIKGPDDNQEAIDRYESYKAGLIKNDIKFNSKLVAPGNFAHGDGRKGLSLILDIRKENIDAVVCCHDLSALEVTKSLNDRGVNVPNKVAVVGFDNIDMCSSYTPSLTTIKQEFYNIGCMAGSFIHDILNNKEVQLFNIIDTQVILRESCGCVKDMSFLDYNTDNKKILGLIEFSKLLTEVELSIYEKYKFEKDIDDSNKKLQKSIYSLSTAIISCLENKSSFILIKTIQDLLLSSNHKQYNVTFWKIIIDDFFKIINSYNYTNDWLFKLSVLYSESILNMYQMERKILEFKRIDDRALVEIINYVGDKLLFSETDLELKDILRKNLSTFKVRNLFIVLFDNNSSNLGNLYFAKNIDNMFEEENISFDISELIPKKLGKSAYESFMINSIRIDNKNVGYILMNSDDAPNIIYSFLTEKISYGFKNIKIVEKMSSYTQELEFAVTKRTKELEEANIKLQERTIRDQMTGLYNRRFLEDVVIPELENKIINKINFNYVIILVDLDHFKLINDVYGHASGDIVIKELGKIFSYVIRPVDYVVRLGGEEFLLILKDFNINFIKDVVNKVRNVIKESVFIMENGEKVSKTCSLGAIFLGGNYPDLINLKAAISIIDKGLYISKNRGRDMGHVIDINYPQFTGCKNPGEYISDNFELCLQENKINLIDCNK